MKDNLKELCDSLDKIKEETLLRGEVTPRNKKDLKALDELAESLQDDAEGDDWLSIVDFRSEISDWLNSELAIFA